MRNQTDSWKQRSIITRCNHPTIKRRNQFQPSTYHSLKTCCRKTRIQYIFLSSWIGFWYSWIWKHEAGESRAQGQIRPFDAVTSRVKSSSENKEIGWRSQKDYGKCWNQKWKTGRFFWTQEPYSLSWGENGNFRRRKSSPCIITFRRKERCWKCLETI